MQIKFLKLPNIYYLKIKYFEKNESLGFVVLIVGDFPPKRIETFHPVEKPVLFLNIK